MDGTATAAKQQEAKQPSASIYFTPSWKKKPCRVYDPRGTSYPHTMALGHAGIKLSGLDGVDSAVFYFSFDEKELKRHTFLRVEKNCNIPKDAVGCIKYEAVVECHISKGNCIALGRTLCAEGVLQTIFLGNYLRFTATVDRKSGEVKQVGVSDSYNTWSPGSQLRVPPERVEELKAGAGIWKEIFALVEQLEKLVNKEEVAKEIARFDREAASRVKKLELPPPEKLRPQPQKELKDLRAE